MSLNIIKPKKQPHSSSLSENVFVTLRYCPSLIYYACVWHFPFIVDTTGMLCFWYLTQIFLYCYHFNVMIAVWRARRATVNQHPLPGKDHPHQNSAETQTGEGCLLDRPGQVVLARLRSGHNRLNAHMHRKLKIVPSPTCPCGEEDQTTEHILQRCNRHQPERIAQWLSGTPLHQKLYGGLEDLKKTTNFITAAILVV